MRHFPATGCVALPLTAHIDAYAPLAGGQTRLPLAAVPAATASVLRRTDRLMGKRPGRRATRR